MDLRICVFLFNNLKFFFMKKSLFFVAVLGLVFFTSCSKDDDFEEVVIPQATSFEADLLKVSVSGSCVTFDYEVPLSIVFTGAYKVVGDMAVFDIEGGKSIILYKTPQGDYTTKVGEACNSSQTGVQDVFIDVNRVEYQIEDLVIVIRLVTDLFAEL